MPTVYNIPDNINEDIVTNIDKNTLDSHSSGGAWGHETSSGRPPRRWRRRLQLSDTPVLKTAFHEAGGEQRGWAETVPRRVGPQLSAQTAGHLLPAGVQEGGGSAAGEGQAERAEGADRAGDPGAGEAEDGSAAEEVEQEGGAELPTDNHGLWGRVQLQGGSICVGQVNWILYSNIFWSQLLRSSNAPSLFRFRALGRLESKFDETMVEYYLAFMAMCKRVAGLPLSEEEGRIDVSWLQNESFSMFSAPNICPCHR